MRYILYLIANILSFSALYAVQPADSITCRVMGTVIGRPDSKEVMVIEAERDFRVHKSLSVPVEDGKFSFVLHDDVPRAYQIIFDTELKNGSWRNRYFFTGNGEIDIISRTDGNIDNDSVISSIPENLLANRFQEIENEYLHPEMDSWYARIDSLYENKAAFIPELQRIMDQYEKMAPGMERDSLRALADVYFRGSREKMYSEEYMCYERKLKDLFAGADSLKRVFISENVSLYGLFAIKRALSYRSDIYNIPDYIRIFRTSYKDRFPDHPYTKEIIDLTEALEVKAGNKYPDYKVTRANGTTEQISSLIKGNIAVIDLWASWCLPCRRHSLELIPLYEKYKDKGFKVIAIARETGDCNAMNRAMEKDGYPWESFIDLNDTDNVWVINNAGNSGGKIILVGADGVIVGTDMPADEIADYLMKCFD